MTKAISWLLVAGSWLTLAASQLAAQQPTASTSSPPRAPDKDYLVLVASEGNDRISLVRFGPAGASVEHVSRIGRNPTEPVGPHGLGVSPDGRYYYVSTAHGFPNGDLWKFTTAGDSLKGRVTLGLFPATLQISPDGLFAYVVNFAVYSEMKPSSVSVVYTDDMAEVARITTCTMPHGSRLNRDGTKHYSACMMDDALVEIDTRTLAVARHFLLKKGAEHARSARCRESAGARRRRAAGNRESTTRGMAWSRRSPVTCPARPRGRNRRWMDRRSMWRATSRAMSSRSMCRRGR